MVEQLRSPMERLRSLDPASSIRLRADKSAVFDAEHQERLRCLMGILSRYGIELFRGQSLPETSLFLVKVTEEGDPPKSLGTCICIKGLVSDEEILPFHMALSQKSVRSYYAPLRLCYERSSVSFVARKVAEKASLIKRPPGDWTLSGSLIRIENDDGAWESTIGGLIMVGGDYYLMTSSDHHQGFGGSFSTAALSAGDDHGPSISSVNNLANGDFDNDVEQALVLVDKKSEGNQTEPTDSPPEREDDDSSPLPHVISLVDEGCSNGHWRLLTTTKDLRLPNLLPSIHLPVDSPEPNQIRNYIRDYKSPQDASRVTINAGASGVGNGHLTGNPSYLMSKGVVQEVWMIQLDEGFSKWLSYFVTTAF